MKLCIKDTKLSTSNEFILSAFFVNQDKQVIYTFPIKALSNQQIYNFSRKLPNISFGTFTGD